VAPEIIQSKGHGRAVDWWALGILIFEMLAGYPPFFDSSPLGIYSKILAGKIEYPKLFSSEVKDLISNLLEQDRSKRLGNRSGGAQEIKDHPWLKDIDWAKMSRRELQAPIIPKIFYSGDTRNFVNYSDDNNYTMNVPETYDPHADIFRDF